MTIGTVMAQVELKDRMDLEYVRLYVRLMVDGSRDLLDSNGKWMYEMQCKCMKTREDDLRLSMKRRKRPSTT